MIRRDMPEVFKIDKDSHNPWDEETFISHLRQRNCIGLICETEEKIIGFVICYLEKQAMSLIKMVVGKEHRRKKVGTLIIDKIKSKLSFTRRKIIEFEVDDIDLGMQLFLRECGFRCVWLYPKLNEYDEETTDMIYLMHYCVNKNSDEINHPKNHAS